MRTFRRAGALPLAKLIIVAAIICYTNAAVIAAGTINAPGPATRATPPVPTEKPTPSLARLRSRLGHVDQLVALRALHLALSQVPDGGTFVWQKRSRSLKGLIKPTRAFRNADGQVCRHVIYALSLGRYLKQIEGIACRQDDGRWHL